MIDCLTIHNRLFEQRVKDLKKYNMSEISIVMTAYNAKDYIAGEIESILNQSFSDFELIVVDDGSTDNTRSIIESYHDKRIHLITNEHDYIRSLNAGLNATSGKFVARMDADDIMHIDRLKIQHSTMEAFPEITVCSSWTNIFGDKIANRLFELGLCGMVEHPVIQLLYDDFVINPTAMIRSSFLKEHALLYKDYTYAEDYKFWADVAMLNGSFYVDPQPLVYKRVDQSQVTFKYRDIQLETSAKIKKEILGFLCDQYKAKYPALPSLYNSVYELLDQDFLKEGEIFQLFYSLFKSKIETLK